MAQLSDTPVQLSPALAMQIIDHAREGKPEEICGILRGRGYEAFEVIPGKNIAEERIENYTVDPQTLLRQFEFEDNNEEMMGIYHSHPVSVAYPSATDAWNAYYPDSIYFICSLEFDDAPVIRAFRMITHFVDVDLAALQAAVDFYETRPGLFAYYQPADQVVSPVLKALIPSVALPFYVVYYQDPATAEKTADDGAGTDWEGEADVRVVELIEHPLA